MSNKLADEKSPYLLEYADDPVDWYPWGEEAFELAKREDKPVFLNIGYSTCHWCHVMHRESFMDPETADALNRTFVCIKVDREQRPDIDSIYMRAAQAISGTGGWPLNIIITPDKKPVFAFTYMPKRSVNGQLGLINLAHDVSEIWKNGREQFEKQAKAVIDAIEETDIHGKTDIKTSDLIERSYDKISNLFDMENGGISGSQKFPNSGVLNLAVQHYMKYHDDLSLSFLERTLSFMATRGLRDHVNGGFFRYATDSIWIIPHFEKMLYTQAELMQAYSEAYMITGKTAYRKVIADIFNFLENNLVSPEGSYYTAMDADVDGEEGKYYKWKAQELKNILGSGYGRFADIFNIKDSGNFADWRGSITGKNILYMNEDIEKYASEKNLDPASLESEIETDLRKIRAAREGEKKPEIDRKILTDLNGMMISALIMAYRATGDIAYMNRAVSILTFIEKYMLADELKHSYFEGDASIGGFLSDYAYTIAAATDLYEVTMRNEYLDLAKRLIEDSLKFVDENRSFIFSLENTLIRERNEMDSEIPSAYAVQAINFCRLSMILEKPEYHDISAAALSFISDRMVNFPVAFPSSIVAEIYLANGFLITLYNLDDSMKIFRKIFYGNVVWIYHKDDELNKKYAATVCTYDSCLPPFGKLDDAIRSVNESENLSR